MRRPARPLRLLEAAVYALAYRRFHVRCAKSIAFEYFAETIKADAGPQMGSLVQVLRCNRHEHQQLNRSACCRISEHRSVRVRVIIRRPRNNLTYVSNHSNRHEIIDRRLNQIFMQLLRFIL